MPLESIAVTFRKGDIMSYTALYRKFRPSTFDQVKGQDHIVQTLKNQINANRIGPVSYTHLDVYKRQVNIVFIYGL